LNSHRVFTLLFAVVLVRVGSAQDQAAQSLPGKQSRELRVYVQQPNGELLQVPKEYSVEDTEHEGMGHTATPWNTAVMLRLPGAKSTVRLKEGDAIVVLAEIPKKIDPRRIELLKFETHGLQRVTYISAFGARGGETHWNTLSFSARQNPDGKWLLEPTVRPQSGEYCFTLPSGNEHFCFGVDKK
jgi:hypothetical protein